ncbi:hypothetical protein [Nocardia caishijiensis]|uniref:Uncharacterized protein n=1 Tax=Nocardia caishijiensis TaxID=184756 RepID=A0ABQ6YKS8_9NOCA|nr:hypothetical protein [Nocardia caishijiensis]KAF0846388.1 hypothetical protein FNL39_105299 [Nocardia caishijiensis]
MAKVEISESISVAVEIPQGYAELPLDAIDEAIARTEALFASLGTGALSSTAPGVLQALNALLNRLAECGTAYCGLGIHLTADGRQISSALAITLADYGAEQNPRLTLGSVLTGRQRAGERFDNAEFLDVAGRLILMVDRTKAVPAPDIPNYDGDEQEIYQVEAIVASPDGSAIAAVELSTPFVEDGSEYLLPMVAVAASIEFGTSARAATTSSLNL